MPTPALRAAIDPASPPPGVALPKSRSYTQWDSFGKAGLIPTSVRCQGYWRGTAFQDTACHSNLPKASAELMARHCMAEHGSQFELWLRKTDGKASPLWAELGANAVEASDFRCAVCDAQVRFHPTAILSHCRPHNGKTKRLYQHMIALKPGAIGCFQLTLGAARSEETLEDSDEFNSTDSAL